MGAVGGENQDVTGSGNGGVCGSGDYDKSVSVSLKNLSDKL